MAALIAQRMFRIPKIVARIYDPPRGQLYRDLGIETFSPTTLGAQLIRDRLADTPYQSIPSFDFGNVTSLIATIGTENAGRTVGEVEVPGKIRVAAIRRGGLVMVASANEKLLNGDEINAIVAPDALVGFATKFLAVVPVAKLAV
jgi:trk system potassium uptake protein TrkA